MVPCARHGAACGVRGPGSAGTLTTALGALWVFLLNFSGPSEGRLYGCAARGSFYQRRHWSPSATLHRGRRSGGRAGERSGVGRLVQMTSCGDDASHLTDGCRRCRCVSRRPCGTRSGGTLGLSSRGVGRPWWRRRFRSLPHSPSVLSLRQSPSRSSGRGCWVVTCGRRTPMRQGRCGRPWGRV